MDSDKHLIPCSGLQVAKNDILHLQNYVGKDLSEKIEDVRSDLKSDFQSTKAANIIINELIQKNIGEQRVLREEIMTANNKVETAMESTKEVKKLFIKIVLIVIGAAVTVGGGNIATNIINQKSTVANMTQLQSTLERQIMHTITKKMQHLK
ncbi:MAG: hypothetical protein GY928_20670 [Colwellia sp.]|nr:hypothetical protein [Colwellia sp.]